MVRHRQERGEEGKRDSVSEGDKGRMHRERKRGIPDFVPHPCVISLFLSLPFFSPCTTPPSLESLSIHALTPPPSPKLEISPRTSKWIYYRERKWIFAFILTSPGVSITAFNHTLFIELTL